MLLFFQSWLQMEQSTFHLLSSRLPPSIHPSIHFQVQCLNLTNFELWAEHENCLSQKTNDKNSNISPCKNIILKKSIFLTKPYA